MRQETQHYIKLFLFKNISMKSSLAKVTCMGQPTSARSIYSWSRASYIPLKRLSWGSIDGISVNFLNNFPAAALHLHGQSRVRGIRRKRGQPLAPRWQVQLAKIEGEFIFYNQSPFRSKVLYKTELLRTDNFGHFCLILHYLLAGARFVEKILLLKWNDLTIA